MYDRILVPLDGSRFAEEVIPYAAALAGVRGAKLALLRVVIDAASEGEDRRYVERLAAAHGAQALCVPARAGVAEVVLAEAGNTPATLVAITSRGRSGVLEALLGSVAQQLVRGAPGPVLVYHPTGSDRTPTAPVKLRRVVLPLDGSEFSEAMGADAARFAHWLGVELEVVRVIDSEAGAIPGLPPGSGEQVALESGYVRSKATQYGREHGVRVNWDVLHGKPADAIASYVGGQRDTILAMLTRRQAPLEAAFLGSVTAGCLRKAGVPILMRLP